MTYRDMQDALMRELRLYHYPVAVSYCESEEKLREFKARARYVTPVKPITFCQWEVAARMQRTTVLADKDALGCSNALVTFGWKEIDANEIKSQLKYCVDLEQAERFMGSKPRLPSGWLKAVVVGPLGDCVLPPDVVHFYCDNMQSYHLAVDYMAATDTHPLHPQVLMSSSACGGGVFCWQQQSFNMGPACSGSYNAGKTERGEVNVFIPGARIEAVVKRMLARIEGSGGGSVTRPGDPFPGSDICKNCPLIVFRKGEPGAAACAGCAENAKQ